MSLYEILSIFCSKTTESKKTQKPPKTLNTTCPHRCIEKPIFQGLSQEALANCVLSLTAASTKITEHSSQLDATLFLIKHLLILREQIAPFQADFTVKETGLDFARTRHAAMRFGQKIMSRSGSQTEQNLMANPALTIAMRQTSGSMLMDFLQCVDEK